MDKHDLSRMGRPQVESLAAFAADLLAVLDKATGDGLELVKACESSNVDLDDMAAFAGIAAERRRANWKKALLSEILGQDAIRSAEPGELDRMLDRLDDALMSIPRFDDYQVLVGRFAGRRPAEYRPGRNDAAQIRENIDRTCDEMVQEAMAWLKQSARKEYVRTGLTDLTNVLPPDVIKTMNRMRIYVMADITRLTDDEIMSVPSGGRMKLALMSRLYQIRTALFTNQMALIARPAGSLPPGSREQDAKN